MYYIFLYGIPLIIMSATFFSTKKEKNNLYKSLLKIITVFSILTFLYSLVLGVIIKVSMLGLYFKKNEEFPSLVLSRTFLPIIVYIILPLNLLYFIIWLLKYFKNKNMKF
jgi:hypothetical protein